MSRSRSRSRSSVEAIQCRVEIVGTIPLIWRQLHILANSSLLTLQITICEVFEWDSWRSYRFEIADEMYGDPDLDYEFHGWSDSSKMTVGRIAKRSSQLDFIYDFESDWHLKVVIEDVFKANINERYPLCTAGAYAPPPLGCRSVEDFLRFKENTKITKFPKARNTIEAILLRQGCDGFDPDLFDLNFVNEVKMSRRRKVSRKN